VVEAKKQAASTDNFDKPSRDWPFKMACEHLCLDLFDPAWEIRHGAGIGLRSILKVHGNGAGKRGNVVFLIPPLSIDLQQ
jgi:TATA-binding protein-associated factor